MSVQEPQHLNNHHRDTLLQIFQHPTSHNIEWSAVVSLLEALGTVQQQQNGKCVVTVGAETEVLNRPKQKDIGVQQVIDLRHLLSMAGYGVVVDELEAKGHEV